MYNMIYRARRKGSNIVTRQRTIFRDYNAEYPPLRQEEVLMKEFGFGIQLQIR